MKKNSRRFWLHIDRILSHDLIKQALILLGLFLLLLGVSYILLSASVGDWQQFCKANHINKWMLPLYLLIDANLFNTLYLSSEISSSWMLLASGFTYLSGLFVFNGMIISLMTNAISNRIERHQNGLIHYLKSGHFIIMGYDDIVPSIITDIFDKHDDPYVLVLTSASPVQINEKLKRTIGEKRLKRVIVNYGHRMSKEEYAAIHLEAAEEIYIAGYRALPAHDAINIECVESICSYLNELKQADRPHGISRITCVFEDLDTYAAFKNSEIFDAVNELKIEFIPYNFYAGWAKKVFVDRCHKDLGDSYIRYPAVFGSGITEDDERYVHIVFVGTTYFAVTFAMEAAQVLHFPNFNKRKDLRTVITFIDLNADTERNIFQTRNRQFFKNQPMVYSDLSQKEGERGTVHGSEGFLDVEFEFIKGDIFSETVQNKLCEWAADRQQCLSIFLAMSNQRNNFAIGMNMPDEIYDNRIPVFIRQDRSGIFVTNLRTSDKTEFPYSYVDDSGRLVTEMRKRNRRYANIYPFGMADTGYCSDELSLKRAKLINYLYCNIANNRFPEEETLNARAITDIRADAEEYWLKLSTANRWSNLYAAYSISCKSAALRAIRGLDPDDSSRDRDAMTDKEIRTMAVVEHNRWNVEKLLMGFRKPRPEEDKYLYLHDSKISDALHNNRKLFIHHDIRPYDELSDVKQLDIEFVKYIPWILDTADRM